MFHFVRAALVMALVAAAPAAAETLRMPILVPVTGFLSLEGISQRDGALLALEQARARFPDLPADLTLEPEVADTGTAPEVAVNALLKALRDGTPPAVVAPMFGTQMLAMMPMAKQARVPLVTVSGTASLTERDNPYVFRFFPTDAVVKAAQARHAVETLGARRIAVLYQTTAYGQSGRDALTRYLPRLGAEIVHQEGLAPSVRDMLPALSKALEARPDALLLHLHARPTALLVRQWAVLEDRPALIAGSAMHQPSTAALLEPSELAGVCAETGASPISGGSAEADAFTRAYKTRFGRAPDAFALGQYDGVMMVLAAFAAGARDAAGVRAHLSSSTHEGIAMTYRSDGTGNMAREALIVCYDGVSRVPDIVAHYDDPAAAIPDRTE